MCQNFHFSSEISFGPLFIDIWRFFSGHADPTAQRLLCWHWYNLYPFSLHFCQKLNWHNTFANLIDAQVEWTIVWCQRLEKHLETAAPKCQLGNCDFVKEFGWMILYMGKCGSYIPQIRCGFQVFYNQCDQKKSPNVYKNCPEMFLLEKW